MLEFIQLVGGYMSRGSIWVFREEVGVTRMSTLSMRDRHLYLIFLPQQFLVFTAIFATERGNNSHCEGIITCPVSRVFCFDFWITVVWHLDFPFSSSKFVKISFYLNFRGCHLLFLIKGLLWNMSVTRKPLWKPSHT